MRAGLVSHPVAVTSQRFGLSTATVFPGTERGTGTAGTVFQEPKPEPGTVLSC